MSHTNSTSINLEILMEQSSKQADESIMDLIDKARDINILNYGKETPLHNAVFRSSSRVVHKLIQKGANINAQDEHLCTPLHEAVRHNNTEAIAMLLYYGADVNIVNRDEFTPFVYGLDKRKCIENFETASWLLELTDKFDGRFTPTENYVKLFRIPMKEDIGEVKRMKIITQIWSKFDHTTMSRDKSMFLSLYLVEARFLAPQWLSGLYTMLDNPHVFELMPYKFNVLDAYCISHFSDVFCAFLTRTMSLTDRIAVISLWLSFGAQIYVEDVVKTYVHYGFDQEVMLLISATPSPLLTLIFALEEYVCVTSDFQTLILFEFLSCVRRSGTFAVARGLVHKSLGFFSWSHYMRPMILVQCQEPFEDYKKILPILKNLPKLPSLIELARNLIVRIMKRKIIKQNTKKMLNPTWFHRAVRGLEVPESVKSVLHFRKPLY